MNPTTRLLLEGHRVEIALELELTESNIDFDRQRLMEKEIHLADVRLRLSEIDYDLEAIPC